MSIPPFDPDDPRLTAYALGEADEADRRAVEAMLADSAEARAEIEQTRALASVLAAEYGRENERYAASRQDIPSFPQPSRHRRFRVATWLQAAAALALCASLLYVGAKTRQHPVAQAAATFPPDAPGAPGAPPPVPEAVDSARAPLQTEPANQSAMDGQSDAGLSADKPLPARVAAPAPAVAAAPPEPPAVQCTVRIRTSTGRFYVGAIVSSGGLILSATVPPDEATLHPAAVLLADGREFSAESEPASLGPGWHTLRIKATGLRAATLGTKAPAEDASLTVAQVDARSGSLTFSPFQPGHALERSGRLLAFDPAGDLLVADEPDSSADAAARAKTASRRAVAENPRVRPFTPAEQKIIQQAINEP